jgi:uncharacterized protein (TIGR03000 family)
MSRVSLQPSVRLAVATILLLAGSVTAEGRRYAVLVGVNEYHHPKLTPLKWAENDAAGLAAVLGKAGYEVILLTGAATADRLKPTRANVEGRLGEVLKAARKGDTVVVALAGHGLQFAGQKDAYFCPLDARPTAAAADTLVSLKRVYDDLEASYATVKVLFVDACRDDPGAGRGSRGVDADTAPPPPKGVAALFSCSAGERAYEHADLKHGVFFHHVLEGLAGKAKDTDDEVTFNALSDYVAKKVKADVRRLYGPEVTQLPHQRGESVGGSPVLVAASGLSTKRMPPDPGPKPVEPAHDLRPANPKTAEIVVLIPEAPTRTTLAVEGKSMGREEAAEKTGKRVLVTPELGPGRPYAYTIEATIEPNNYTRITRTRQVPFRMGEVVTVDLRKEDAKFPDHVLCRWVPTPRTVIRDMCKLARVTKEDVVLDPGCGDAVMLVVAAREFQVKRGIGIDIDPKLVSVSQENVEKAGLKDRISVKEGNALKLGAGDLKDASVVMLYMGNDINIRMRPLLWEHLKPGARVVSHRFVMGDWKPDDSITVRSNETGEDEEYHLHVWTVTGKEKAGDYPKVDPAKLNQ